MQSSRILRGPSPVRWDVVNSARPGREQR